MIPMSPRDIIDFWYSDRLKQHWFASTPALDKEILQKYAGIWERAAKGELDSWCATPEGSLALAIILDQFPLNMFRGMPESFSTEAKAIEVALQAVKNDLDKQLDINKRLFLYMPLMHSEDSANQDLSVMLFAQPGLEGNLAFAQHHRKIIKEFGRFPHRNEILGRTSTLQETAYLHSPNAFLG